ncbi:MAG: Mediator of RNA polymerase II transcription subunit 18 [Phylliscum demangeonii]|nr:MAG: Mediator of RNA polymerase II transcription subunit 18 [Phylliscum demangeonii]
MHELLLFGQVPAASHDQVLKIIAGIAGMQAEHVVEHHVVFKPKRAPASSRGGPIGASQAVQTHQPPPNQLNGELFHLQLIGDVAEHSEGGGTEGNAKNHVPPKAWSLCFFDLPEVPGRRPVTSRLVSSVDITQGNAFDFMDGLGYARLSEYIVDGDRVVYNNVVALLHRVVRCPQLKAEPSAAGKDGTKAPDDQTWTPLDPSSAYILQASIRVQDGSKPELMTVAINELQSFRDMLKGVVDLEVGDRLAMDPRVR